MPEFGILPAAQPHPFAGQNTQAFIALLKTIGEAENLRRQKLLQSDVLGAISQGGDPQQMMANIANVLTSQQPGYSQGFAGLAQRIASPFAAPTTGLEDVITSEMLKSVIMSPSEQARLEYYKRPKTTKIQELINEGYSREEARMIRDISHGLKPRASARKQYENLSDVEKMDFLSKLKQRAEGQYYGVLKGEAEAEAVDKGIAPREVRPRQPKLLKWVNEELQKLSILQEETTDEPQTQEEFIEKVQSIEDKTEAEAYYNKWVSKWQ